MFGSTDIGKVSILSWHEREGEGGRSRRGNEMRHPIRRMITGVVRGAVLLAPLCTAPWADAQGQTAPQDPRVTACVLRGGTPQDCGAALVPPPAPPAPPAAAPTDQAARADQPDWSDCSGQDQARIVAACGRIIADQGASAEDRGNAHFYLGGAHLAKGDLDGAIAEYNRAIQLSPQHLMAHVNRALAYARKHEDYRASGDYAAAREMDWFKLEEIVAANPELSAIARYNPPAVPADQRPPSQLPAPTPEELNECATQGSERAVAACTLVLDERNYSPREGFAVALALAQAYLRQGDTERALAAYDALISGLESALARAGRAVAYSLKQDRDRAIVDYVVARRIDAKTVSEMEARDPRLAVIAAMARVSPPPESAVRGFDIIDRPGGPRLGIQIKAVTPSLAAKLKLPALRGVYVSVVSDDGPAKLAGVAPGDVVVRFDGEEIVDPKDIIRFVKSSPVGKRVEIAFIRNGAEERRTMTLQ